MYLGSPISTWSVEAESTSVWTIKTSNNVKVITDPQASGGSAVVVRDLSSFSSQSGSRSFIVATKVIT